MWRSRSFCNIAHKWLIWLTRLFHPQLYYDFIIRTFTELHFPIPAEHKHLTYSARSRFCHGQLLAETLLVYSIRYLSFVFNNSHHKVKLRIYSLPQCLLCMSPLSRLSSASWQQPQYKLVFFKNYFSSASRSTKLFDVQRYDTVGRLNYGSPHGELVVSITNGSFLFT